MNKKYIDDFYNRVSEDKKCEIFALSLPLFLINKDLMVKSENFLKTNYDLLHTDIDVLASLYFNGKDYIMSPTELYDALRQPLQHWKMVSSPCISWIRSKCWQQWKHEKVKVKSEL